MMSIFRIVTSLLIFAAIPSIAAGRYRTEDAAEWKIVSGRPVRTLLTDSSDVVDLFLKNIDPPRFD